jgi:hypothetical protein
MCSPLLCMWKVMLGSPHSFWWTTNCLPLELYIVGYVWDTHVSESILANAWGEYHTVCLSAMSFIFMDPPLLESLSGSQPLEHLRCTCGCKTCSQLTDCLEVWRFRGPNSELRLFSFSCIFIFTMQLELLSKDCKALLDTLHLFARALMLALLDMDKSSSLSLSGQLVAMCPFFLHLKHWTSFESFLVSFDLSP